ncbi:MAG: DUF5615 family PIN-like protein [Chloroflexi bacterium]|nr:DUF5615 family PIN-like protein [Chloroflexota bacterium]
MRALLFDQNLSPRLVSRLAEVYPNSAHVHSLGLGSSPDRDIWEYAYEHDYIIVTKDADFVELSLLFGFPPKVIWIRRGNCPTHELEKLLHESYQAIASLDEDPGIGILTLL